MKGADRIEFVGELASEAHDAVGQPNEAPGFLVVEPPSGQVREKRVDLRQGGDETEEVTWSGAGNRPAAMTGMAG